MKMELSGRLRLTGRMPRALFVGRLDALASAQTPELIFFVQERVRPCYIIRRIVQYIHCNNIDDDLKA